MKKWARISILVVFMILIIGPVKIPAQANETDGATASPPSEGQQDVKEDTSSPDYQAKLKERLAKNKEAAKTNATKAQQTRIKARCKSAQGKITSVNANIKTFRTARIEVYNNVIARLNELNTKLKSAGADTVELDKQIIELQALVNSFQVNVTELNQAAADLANMDCAADPSGFKAALEVMRTERKSVSDESAAIRAYITDTIKPSLQLIRQSIEKPEEAESN